MKLRKGDDVVGAAGKDIGKRGTITQVLPDTREGHRHRTAWINVVKRHQKPSAARTIQGGIIDKEMPIHVSNVALWCNKCGATRIGYRFGDDGKKVRICRRAGVTSDGEDRPPDAPACGALRQRDQAAAPGRARADQRHAGAAVRQDRGEHGCRSRDAAAFAARRRGHRPHDDHRQKPSVHKAKKSIANFKLREGNEIGAKVTLRGDRMWEFYDRLVSLAIPRIRDFRGMSPKQFDGHGNYTFGLTEQLVFPEIDYDRIDSVRGMDITIVTTAETDDQGRALLRALGFPFSRDGQG